MRVVSVNLWLGGGSVPPSLGYYKALFFCRFVDEASVEVYATESTAQECQGVETTYGNYGYVVTRSSTCPLAAVPNQTIVGECGHRNLNLVPLAVACEAVR